MFGRGLDAETPTPEEIECFLEYQPSGSDWAANGSGLADLSDTQFRALCKQVVQELKKHPEAVRHTGRKDAGSDTAA